MKILSFGSCNIDYVYQVPHIVQPGETLAAPHLETFPGGKGLNQTIAIARAGVPVCFAGCIGEDGRWLKELLKTENVDVSHLRITDERTGHAMIQVDETGENSIVIFPGANSCNTAAYMDQVLKDFSSGDYLLVQNEISNLPYLIEAAYAKGMKIVLNPSPFDESLRNVDLDKLHALVLNETEAAFWADSSDEMAFLYMIAGRYPALHVALTLGKQGCLYQKGTHTLRQPAYQVSVVDTTGAGDTFMGYFLAGLYRNFPMEEVLRLSSAAAALAVSRMGAASSVPLFQEAKKAAECLVPLME